jgi:hypothetical protein
VQNASPVNVVVETFKLEIHPCMEMSIDPPLLSSSFFFVENTKMLGHRFEKMVTFVGLSNI